MKTQELLALKQKIKRKIPRFERENARALPRINSKWRKPKGIHSKLRHGFAGHRNKVEPGYGTPAQLRGIGKDGLKQVLVHTLSELEKIKSTTEGIIVANIGTRKKVEILKTAQQKKIIILNIKKPEEFIKKTEEDLKKRKETHKTKIQTKEAKTKQREKESTKKQEKTEQKKQPESTETVDETKKEEQKKELDKLLTKKEA